MGYRLFLLVGKLAELSYKYTLLDESDRKPDITEKITGKDDIMQKTGSNIVLWSSKGIQTGLT